MTDSEPLPSLRGLDLPPGYDSGDDVLNHFYVPALRRATSYARSVGYFRSSSLSVAARGLSRFLNHGGTVRLLCGAAITEEDREALQGKATLDGAFAERLAAGLVTSNEVDRRRLEVLAWLIRNERLQVRVAIAVDETGDPIATDGQLGYFHEKVGVLRDGNGDAVVFQGSINESATAWTKNFESFSVYRSWDGTADHFTFWASRFEQRWNGHVPGFRVYPLPEAAAKALLEQAPAKMPGERDVEEPPPVGDDATVARYMQIAPRLPWAGDLAEATSGVRLFPHQRQNVARLAGMYPRSWLIGDEVGLGKTISAGMSLRRLVLNGEVAKALILAPANVCRQWQDELFEKFALWVPRLDQGKIHGAHPEDIRPAGANPYADHPLLLASSHLARRPDQQRLLLAAAPYDLLVVDEAHHARRQHGAEDRYRPSRLLELLDAIRRQGAARATWLLTATPLQTSAVEMVDLLRQTGLTGPLTNEDAFVRFYAELAKTDDRATAWAWLAEQVRRTPALPRTGAEDELAADIARRVGVVKAEMVTRFGRDGADVKHRIAELGPDGCQALRDWLRALSPVRQYVARHSRSTLKAYRRQGLISENLAERDVRPYVVDFGTEEQQLYHDLERLIDRLLEAHGKRRGAGFVLTVYRRRLTSSWAAIQKTLLRRLASEETFLEQGLLDEADDEGLDTDEAGHIKDSEAVPLTKQDLEEMRGYAERIGRVPDRKFEALEQHVEEARGTGHSTIVFTQFTDTLDALRDRLHHRYRSQLATFTGDGGRVFRENEGWIDISKRDLIEAIKARAVTVLLATDAASEGLNLQSCSYLINYDMPWNPMRVEQRIGRIDRLGQARNTIVVRNFFIAGTVEEEVYRALASRIDMFSGIVGGLQPILGAVEGAFHGVFRAPASERARARRHGVETLIDLIDSNPGRGLPLEVEDDPLPIPAAEPGPITLTDLREVVIERFGVVLDQPDQPITTDPSRASRDPASWVALATYGHPRLAIALDKIANRGVDRSLVLLDDAPRGPAVAVRADTVPPRPAHRLTDIDELGPAVSRAEAESVAVDLLERSRRARQNRYDDIERRNREDSFDKLRKRYTELVAQIMTDAVAAARGAGTTTEPALLWLDLKDEAGMIRYLDALREALRLDKGPLLRPPTDDGTRVLSDIEWSRAKHLYGEQVRALAIEIKTATN
ncbi:helicase-related protein [Micromonospora yasonensis]|uniref:DEAD/DEAH box helicase n=1 Tax=Micromonospora yasonensis TaxID=1128667 RepID=UPI0022324D11|nr:helicase-related protein [Micromonospora yasonensis]MCW3838565.1 helicase-related protein [Micromonospora yasonensis]